MLLKFIRFDLENNTIEATWQDPETKQPVRCHNYPQEQRAEFVAEVEGGEAFAAALGWGS